MFLVANIPTYLLLLFFFVLHFLLINYKMVFKKNTNEIKEQNNKSNKIKNMENIISYLLLGKKKISLRKYKIVYTYKRERQKDKSNVLIAYDFL